MKVRQAEGRILHLDARYAEFWEFPIHEDPVPDDRRLVIVTADIVRLHSQGPGLMSAFVIESSGTLGASQSFFEGKD